MADKKWYVVHAYSGFEKSVQRTLTERIKRSELQEQFGKILVPVEEVVEMKSGQKAISERKFFPGYVLVEMEMTDDTWHLVKSTPKVTGFVGGTANRPTPITQKEVDAILREFNSRPHWGKLHFLGGDDVTALYPKANDFRALRSKLDPEGRFLNDHLSQLFA